MQVVPSLPFVSAITPLTESCNRPPAQVEIIELLRRTQADTKVAGATWVDLDSTGLPRSCFHLTGQVTPPNVFRQSRSIASRRVYEMPGVD